MIENEESGVFFPQNAEYVRTSDMVLQIAEVHHRHIHMTRLFNPVLKLLGRNRGRVGRLVNKAFGNMVYDKEMSRYRENYCIYGLSESICLTEQQ